MKQSGLVRQPGKAKDVIIQWLIVWLVWILALAAGIALLPGTVEWILQGK